jgi:hypothetical protein
MVGYKRRWKNHNPNPHSTLHPKPIPKKPKNLKLNTLFFFFQQILIYWYLPRKPCVAGSTSTIISKFRNHTSPIKSHDSLLLLLHLALRTWVSGLRYLALTNWRSQTIIRTTDDHKQTDETSDFIYKIRAQRNLIQVHAWEVRGWLVVDTYCPYNVLKMNCSREKAQTMWEMPRTITASSLSNNLRDAFPVGQERESR